MKMAFWPAIFWEAAWSLESLSPLALVSELNMGEQQSWSFKVTDVPAVKSFLAGIEDDCSPGEEDGSSVGDFSCAKIVRGHCEKMASLTCNDLTRPLGGEIQQNPAHCFYSSDSSLSNSLALNSSLAFSTDKPLPNVLWKM